MTQYATHLVSSHSKEVPADVPDGTVQLKFDSADEWITVPVEDAMDLIRSSVD